MKTINKTTSHKNIILFAQGLFGGLLLTELENIGLSVQLYTYAENSVRRKSDLIHLRQGYPFRYINERKYNPSLIKLTEKDIVFCAEWTKDFFHQTPPPCQYYFLQPSLLPKYRGYGAVSEQFLRGAAIGGITLYMDNPRTDCGDILYQEEIPISFNDYPADYLEKCASKAAKFIISILNERSFSPFPQNELEAINVPRIRTKNGLIDLNMNAINVYNTIRAFSYPYFGAYYYYKGEKITIYKALCEKWSGTEGKPGEIISNGNYGVEIAVGEGSITLTNAVYKNKTYKHEDIIKIFT